MKRARGILWFGLAALLLLASCSGESGFPIPICKISGTITDNSGGFVKTGDTVSVAVGKTATSLGPYLRQISFPWPGGATADYSLNVFGLAQGNYYVMALTGNTAYWGHSGLVAVDCGSIIDIDIHLNMN